MTEELTHVDTPVTGDCYDEDSGEYLGSIDLTEDGKQVLPAQIALYFEGYFYVFKPSHKYKDESAEAVTKVVTLEENLSATDLLKRAREIKDA